MFRELRRKDRGLNEREVMDLMENGKYGLMSTIGRDGYPYGIPLSYAYINKGIYFHSAREGHKLDNLSHNNKVSFCIIGSEETLAEQFSVRYTSIILFGTTCEVFKEEKTAALLALVKKYSPDYLEEGIAYIGRDMHKTRVYRIAVEHFTGKSNL